MLQLNFFQIISLILALSAFIKVFFGVFFHQQLYSWAGKQYGQGRRTLPVNLLLVYALSLLILVWTATLINYVQYGWILTAFITMASLKSLGLLLNWQKTSEKFTLLIKNAGAKLWFVDLFVAILGLVFVFLGFWVYQS